MRARPATCRARVPNGHRLQVGRPDSSDSEGWPDKRTRLVTRTAAAHARPRLDPSHPRQQLGPTLWTKFSTYRLTPRRPTLLPAAAQVQTPILGARLSRRGFLGLLGAPVRCARRSWETGWWQHSVVYLLGRVGRGSADGRLRLYARRGEAGDGGAVRGEVGVEAVARRPPRHALRYLCPEAIAVEAVGCVGCEQSPRACQRAGTLETLRANGDKQRWVQIGRNIYL